MRRKARVDGNHKAIVSALRKAGCVVLSLAAVGKGCPDLLVCRANRLSLVEVKDGSKPPSARKLTPDQLDFHAVWPVTVITSVDDALQFLNK